VKDAPRHRARKRFGQHFLVDQGVIHSILRHSGLDASHRVLEIGPGRGSLTVPLARRVGHVLAVEKDRDLVPILLEKLEGKGVTNVTLVNEDILGFDMERVGAFAPGKAVVLGNLPYNISSPVLERLITNRHLFQKAVLMFQKEVADRLTAHPGTKTFGALTVMVGYHARVARLIQVKSGAFIPRPRVDSAVISLDFEAPHPRRAPDDAWFRKVVRAAFAHRRKTVQNSLLTSFPSRGREEIAAALDSCGIEPGRRAETLSIDDFIDLSKALDPEA